MVAEIREVVRSIRKEGIFSNNTQIFNLKWAMRTRGK